MRITTFGTEENSSNDVRQQGDKGIAYDATKCTASEGIHEIIAHVLEYAFNSESNNSAAKLATQIVDKIFNGTTLVCQCADYACMSHYFILLSKLLCDVKRQDWYGMY